MPRTEGPEYHRQVQQLKEEVNLTRQRYEESREELEKVRLQNYGLDTPDGSFATSSAQRHLRFALHEYTEALKRYSYFVVHGKMPGE